MKEIKKVKVRSVIGSPPVIFITGGSRGSQSINNAVELILRPLLSKYRIFHQTGGLDYLKFSDIKQKLPVALRKNYEVFLRVNPMAVSRFFQRADILVSRAGANTVSEILTIKRPSILIPLPISYLDEQTLNAKIAEEWGIAKIIPQNELTAEKLTDTIEKITENYSKIVNKVKLKQSPDTNASKNLVSLVSQYLK
jgi:UDP-N-acetylglucosamine--N-acetylmuramyl-(pentapeptide) pyrophosphoryl-undecaprenol N-acetylglucosamine transferase